MSAETVVGLVKKAIMKSFKSGIRFFLLDGFPRNMENIRAWNKVMRHDCDSAGMLFFAVSEDEMVRRLIGRSKTSGRADDNIESIKKRMATFNKETVPITAEFKKRNEYYEVDASGTPDHVYKTTKAFVKAVINKFSVTKLK